MTFLDLRIWISKAKVKYPGKRTDNSLMFSYIVYYSVFFTKVFLPKQYSWLKNNYQISFTKDF